MRGAVLRPSPLTRKAFAPFGDVLEVGGSSVLINDGETDKFAGRSVSRTRTAPAMHLFRARQSCRSPKLLRQLERHPHGSQAFLPTTNDPFLVVVAEAVPRPLARHLLAFWTNGRQGINLGPNVWHHHLLTPVEGQVFWVVDDGGPDNLDVVTLDPAVTLEFRPEPQA